ncbi:hypothetical protein DSECCO2_623380 [anaerobic digester metagenome]
MRAFNNPLGNARQLGNLNTIAVVHRARDNAAQKGDVVSPFFDRRIVVFNTGQVLLQFGELMVMGGEQCLGPQLLSVRDEFQHRTGNAHAIKGRGTAPDLV